MEFEPGLLFPGPRLPAPILPRPRLFPPVAIGTPLLQLAIVPNTYARGYVQQNKNEHQTEENPGLINDALNHRAEEYCCMGGEPVAIVETYQS